jgi:penicillin G amidase
VPSQNLVYADVDGHIGYQAPGRIPVRTHGDGTLPLPGWTGEHDLGADASTSRSCRGRSTPEDGLLITANQAVLPEDAEPFLTADPNAGYRAARIHELLGDRDGLTLDDLLAVQLDEHNGNAAALVPFLLDVDVDEDESVAALQEVLRGWDLQDDVDSAGGAAFNATWRHLLARTFHDELPEWAHPPGRHAGGRWSAALLDEPDSPWWDDRTTPTRSRPATTCWRPRWRRPR